MNFRLYPICLLFGLQSAMAGAQQQIPTAVAAPFGAPAGNPALNSQAERPIDANQQRPATRPPVVPTLPAGSAPKLSAQEQLQLQSSINGGAPSSYVSSPLATSPTDDQLADPRSYFRYHVQQLQ